LDNQSGARENKGQDVSDGDIKGGIDLYGFEGKRLFIDAIDYPMLLTYPGPLPVNPVKASN